MGYQNNDSSKPKSRPEKELSNSLQSKAGWSRVSLHSMFSSQDQCSQVEERQLQPLRNICVSTLTQLWGGISTESKRRTTHTQETKSKNNQADGRFCHTKDTSYQMEWDPGHIWNALKHKQRGLVFTCLAIKCHPQWISSVSEGETHMHLLAVG